MAGPVISEFAKVGLIAGVEEGKVAIKKDKVVAKKGDEISKELAGVLRKLKIPDAFALNYLFDSFCIGNISYTTDEAEARRQADENRGTAFILNPVTPTEVINIANNRTLRNRVKKATCFYPKSLAGPLIG